MRPVSSAFLRAVTGSHRSAVRAVLVDSVPQFGANPTGIELPVISGDVTLSARTDVKSTLSLTIPGRYWDQVQPYGAEIFVARGVRSADGRIELAALGYHRIEQAEQDDGPNGPIQLTCLDRVAQLQQNRLVFPLPVDEGATHRQVFERLINGGEGVPLEGVSYAAYPGAVIPIDWPAYDPDDVSVFGYQVIADDAYAFMAGLAAEQNCVLRFDGEGRLTVVSTVVDAAVPVASLAGGAGGTRVKLSRTTSRRGVCNIVTSYGSDPRNATQFVTVFNANGPLAWNRTMYPAFGPAPRYFDSPLLQDDAAVEAASARLLDRYTGLPLTMTIQCVPNPALEPDDVIDVPIGTGVLRCVIDSVTVPLTADRPARVVTRTLNDSEVVDDDLGF